MPAVPEFEEYGGLDDFTTGIGSESAGVSQWGAVSGINLPAPGGACNQVSYSIKGHAFTFPDSDGCIALGRIRSILEYFLYLGTVIGVWGIATRGV